MIAVGWMRELADTELRGLGGTVDVDMAFGWILRGWRLETAATFTPLVWKRLRVVPQRLLGLLWFLESHG